MEKAETAQARRSTELTGRARAATWPRAPRPSGAATPPSPRSTPRSRGRPPSGPSSAATFPADLLALYEKIRAAEGGVGAGEIERGRCGGCRLDLMDNEKADIRAAAVRRGAAPRGVRPDHGAHGRVRPVSGRRLVVEADGGSRGNPGPAGYGAVVRDAVTGEVLAERAAGIGTGDQQRRRVRRAHRRAAGRRWSSTRPRSRCGWTPSSSSSR